VTSHYIDADHAGCSDTSRSTSGWAIYAIQSGGRLCAAGLVFEAAASRRSLYG
jgi:hypothetical protein